jgi:hypothetical protein
MSAFHLVTRAIQAGCCGLVIGMVVGCEGDSSEPVLKPAVSPSVASDAKKAGADLKKDLSPPVVVSPGPAGAETKGAP